MPVIHACIHTYSDIYMSICIYIHTYIYISKYNYQKKNE